MDYSYTEIQISVSDIPDYYFKHDMIESPYMKVY